MTVLVYLSRILFLYFFKNENLDVDKYHFTFLLNSLPFVLGYSLMKALGTQKVKIFVDQVNDVDGLRNFVLSYLTNNELVVINSTDKRIVLARGRADGISKYLRRKEYYKVVIQPTGLIITGPVDRLSKDELFQTFNARS